LIRDSALTSGDGTAIDAGLVSPAELYATLYRARGIDPAKEHGKAGGRKVPLVERGRSAVKGALR
jgi:hypothetical protein